MPQAKLTHTLGDNINQSLLIGDNLCCFLKKLSRHMAQGRNRAERLGRELKDTRHAACKRGGNELRCEHDKMSVDFPNEAARCQRFSSGRAQSNFRPSGRALRRSGTTGGSGNGTPKLAPSTNPTVMAAMFVLRTKQSAVPKAAAPCRSENCVVTAVAPKL
jgi:hypothetical protein